MIHTAMIFAAGLGSRLKPFTNHHPKALAVVNGKSLLQRNVEYLLSYGIKNMVVNVHHFAEQIIDAVHTNDGWGANIIISDESAEVLETGGGLQFASQHLQKAENFVVMNADILTTLRLTDVIQYHEAHKPFATLATTKRSSSRQLLFTPENELCGWQNTVTQEQKMARDTKVFHAAAFSGIHVISNALLNYLQPGKYSMIDVYLELAKNHSIHAFDHSDSILLDVGKPESLEKAQTLFA
jgi:N-acetyl-alpha-D-muramate 1-phosphate uridylyltransferase